MGWVQDAAELPTHTAPGDLFFSAALAVTPSIEQRRGTVQYIFNHPS